MCLVFNGATIHHFRTKSTQWNTLTHYKPILYENYCIYLFQDLFQETYIVYDTRISVNHFVQTKRKLS